MGSRAASEQVIRWSRNRGRNGWDTPIHIDDDMSAESYNVVLQRGGLGERRDGMTGTSITGDGTILSGYRFVPGQEESAAELLWVEKGATVIDRIAAGTTSSDLTMKDAIASGAHLVDWATLNGKCYIAYDSTVNRLHVFDPGLSTTTVRRTGLATPAAPTVADTGSGSYAATLRYYRVQWRVKSGSRVQRQSLLGPSQSFTPSGSGTDARVTQPSVPSEGETHWAIFGSTDDAVYYELSEVAIGTTTYDDSEAPATDYDDNEAAPLEGAYTPFPSVKYLVSTGERLVGYGVWESSAGDSLDPKSGRVYFTPVLDATNTDDDERISNTTAIKGYIDISRNAGSEDRALAWFDDTIFVFQSKSIHMLIPTGVADDPYRRVMLSGELGAVSQKSTFIGEDEQGRACLYWLDPRRGPMRYGANGIEWCGYDVQDVWATVNTFEPSGVAHAQCHGCYHPGLRACFFWVAENDLAAHRAIVFFVREGRSSGPEGVRGGWVIWEPAPTAGAGAGYYVVGSVMWPDTIGATMSGDLNMYLGWVDKTTGLNANAFFASTAGQNVDNGIGVTGYVRSKAWAQSGVHRRTRMLRSYAVAEAVTNATITQTVIRNFGDETNRTSTISLTPTGSETHVVRRFEASHVVDANTFQVQLGDASAASFGWRLDEWVAPVEDGGEV